MGLIQDKFPWTNIHELNLDWILKHFKEFIMALDELTEWKEQHETEYQQLKDLYDDLMTGNYPESFEQSLEEWINKNGVEIISKKIKAVYFGLTNDGYFCAYIPESWSDIQFDTVTDYSDPLYGHLMLLYD